MQKCGSAVTACQKVLSLTYRSSAFVILTSVDFLDEKSTAASIFRKRCSCGASISVHGISIVGRCSVSFFQHFHHRLYYIKKGRFCDLF